MKKLLRHKGLRTIIFFGLLEGLTLFIFHPTDIGTFFFLWAIFFLGSYLMTLVNGEFIGSTYTGQNDSQRYANATGRMLESQLGGTGRANAGDWSWRINARKVHFGYFLLNTLVFCYIVFIAPLMGV